MREEVCLVLNEREALKKQLAEELESSLRKSRIAVNRLPAGEHTPKVILERSPRVVVVDYLLGDVSTAIDLLTFLKDKSSDTRVILWTDEPSVHVAVQAMKLGASDYIELSQTSSLEKVIVAIENCLSFPTPPPPQKGKKLSSSEKLSEKLIAQSKSFQATLALAQSVAKRNQPIVVLLGESGSGRSSLGEYIHSLRSHAGKLRQIDFDTWPDDIRNICGDNYAPRIVPYLSHQGTVFIDHAEFDTGELLEHVTTRYSAIWGKETTPTDPMLIVGTSDTKTAHAWARLVKAEVIEIPPLKARAEDFWPLVQRFFHEAHQFGENNKLKLSAPMIDELANLTWPGNITELRAAIIEALTIPLSQLQIELTQNEKKSASSEEPSSKDEQLIIRAVIAAKSRWERYQLSKPFQPESLVARQALEKAFGNIRIAASSLGTGVSQIQAAIAQTPQSQTASSKQLNN